MLALLPPPEFVQWGGVQATIEEEARLKAEGLVAAAAGTLVEESGLKPSITVRQGEASKVIREIIAQTPDIAALVAATTKSGAPGTLASYFASSDGGLPGPLRIVPGGQNGRAE